MTLKACICSSGLQVRDDRNADGIRAWLCAFALAVACAFAFAFLLPLAPDAAYGAQTLTAANADLQLAAQGDSSASAANSPVTDAKTPRATADASLLWSVKFTKGYVSPGVIVDDAIIVTSGRGKNGVISKLDRKTGEVIAEAAMHYSSTYSLIAPTYADGKVFVTLTNGAMEAFDAKTLESLWYYQHEDGGQGNCQVVYSDGLVYTGYWIGETMDCSFVCLDAQTGQLVWEQSNTGGYYYAGALAVGDYLLFGCDDGKPEGEAGASYVRCVDKRTGEVVSSVEVAGDQRSSIAYDPDLGRIYFTSRPGYLYSAELDAQTGKLSGLLSLSVGSSTTATPAVHDGRVYVGASSGSFSEGTLSVVDASSLKMLYQLGKASGIGGTVKSTPLVSTAYAGDAAAGGDGRLYLYLTVNYPPGGITMVSVEPGSTNAGQAKVVELFTPPSEMQQYCIASVVCDEDGNLYYRNDSNYLMCVGPKGADPGDDDDPPEEDTKTGWVQEDGKWYYYDNGTMLTNKWMKDSKGWVYLGEDGAMLTNKWQRDSKGWCYMDASGYAVTGKWKQVDGKWYYFDGGSHMVASKWMKDSKGWAYLDSNGAMATNKWVRDSKGWCYVGPNGYCVTNQWKKDSKGWVYLGADGRMATNKWVRDSKGWCYVGSDGYAVHDQWKKDSKGWCYLDENCRLVTSAWKQIGGKWYYFDADGHMASTSA